jgi:hypothetical protein
MLQLTDVDEMAPLFKSLLKSFAEKGGGNDALRKAGIALDDGSEAEDDEEDEED